MSLKLRALGFALLAAMAIGAIAAINASATVSGHFVSEAPDGHTIVSQESSPESLHGFVIRIDGGARIECEKFAAFGTASSGTVQQVEGTTEASGCHTEGQPPGGLTIHTNGCAGRGTSNSAGTLTGELVCPSGNMVVTHPNCSISIPPQTTNGFTPTTITTFGKHAITLDVNIQYTVHYEAGICIFLGTKHTASVVGSTIIWGQDTVGNPVGITST